jgi:hypothetical protein
MAKRVKKKKEKEMKLRSKTKDQEIITEYNAQLYSAL